MEQTQKRRVDRKPRQSPRLPRRRTGNGTGGREGSVEEETDTFVDLVKTITQETRVKNLLTPSILQL
jgi:hypothetical protein